MKVAQMIKQMVSSLYSPDDIRTSNMSPDRSSDLVFDPIVEPSLTQQQFQDECDINFIVERNQATGLITHLNRTEPVWGDFGDSVDYQTALGYLREAQASFMSLPAKVRARFENDPGQFLDFMQDSSNIEEMISLGLANKIDLPSEPTPPSIPAKKALKTPPDDSQA